MNLGSEPMTSENVKNLIKSIPTMRKMAPLPHPHNDPVVREDSCLELGWIDCFFLPVSSPILAVFACLVSLGGEKVVRSSLEYKSIQPKGSSSFFLHG